jgi:hypothetical protein
MKLLVSLLLFLLMHSGSASSEQHAKKGIRRISVQMRQTTQMEILIKKQILHPSITPGKYEIKRR